jgi:hypothetical protein
MGVHAYAAVAVCWFGKMRAPLLSLAARAIASPAAFSFSCGGTIAEPRSSGACESGIFFSSTAIGS